MGLFEPDFSRHEKRQMQAAFIFAVGLFTLLIGVSVHSTGVIVFGLLCVVSGGLFIYRDIKARTQKKRIAAEEAEIRAYQLRQARGSDQS